MSKSVRRCLFLVVSLLAGGCQAADQGAGSYRFEEKPLSGDQVGVCRDTRCRKVDAPEKLQFQIEEEYATKFEDLDGDGIKELIASGAPGTNRCISIYKIRQADGVIEEYRPGPESICNYRLRDGRLYSKAKDGASWVEEEYAAAGGQLVLLTRDSCVGCGYVNRETYRQGTPANRRVVSDESDMASRKPLVSRVQVEKALLYSAPQPAAKNGMYLVRGDEVELIERSTGSGEAMFKVLYRRQGKSPIEKWVACADIGRCG